MILSAVITEADEGGYVAYNPETGTSNQGAIFDEAVANLREATELYSSVFPLAAKWRKIGAKK
jgi:predicted RNase H-like HicB family nuclease